MEAYIESNGLQERANKIINAHNKERAQNAISLILGYEQDSNNLQLNLLMRVKNNVNDIFDKDGKLLEEGPKIILNKKKASELEEKRVQKEMAELKKGDPISFDEAKKLSAAINVLGLEQRLYETALSGDEKIYYLVSSTLKQIDINKGMEVGESVQTR